MGITNIQYLFQVDEPVNHAVQVQAALEQHLVDAHRRGEHPWGSKRRECPLCQLGK